MRSSTFTLALVLAGCSSPEPPADPVGEEQYITIDADALEAARLALAERDPTAQLDVLENYDGMAVLAYDARDFQALSVLMHELHNRCGGFMLHDSIDTARETLTTRSLAPLATPVTYTIDNAATVGPVLDELDEGNITAQIQELSALQTRHYLTPFGLQASILVRDRWQAIADHAGRTDVVVELMAHDFQQKTVIVTIPGSTLADEVVVVGGHLDSIAPGSASAPGADDDASGIATLTEVYRALIAKNYHPQRTVKFIAYAGEEQGLRGSKAVVARYQAEQLDVVGVMQLDMTNFKGSIEDIVLVTDFTNADQNAFIGDLVDTYLHLPWTTTQCGFGCSDHASWHRGGYVVSFPLEAKFGEHNTSIHSTNDTLARSGNGAAHAVKFARTGVAFVAELAKGSLASADNAAPTLVIESPTSGQVVPRDAQVTLRGTASDAEDGVISGGIRWSSSIDGDLGTGASRTVALSPGAHAITAIVADSDNAISTTTVSITVTGIPSGDYTENFEGALAWTATGAWHLANNSACLSPSSQSPTHAMYFGSESTCTYAGTGRVQGAITSPVIDSIKGASTLSFKYVRKVEAATGTYDITTVEVLTSTATTVVWTRSSLNASSTGWENSGPISLAQFAGSAITIRFRFDSVDGTRNNFLGWFVDDVIVTR
jgi:bacterial leucyl aminopeptidase